MIFYIQKATTLVNVRQNWRSRPYLGHMLIIAIDRHNFTDFLNDFERFLPRDMLSWYMRSSCACMSVCLSVCLSVSLNVRLLQVGGFLLKQQTHHANNMYHTRYPRDWCGFLMPKISAKFDRDHPWRGSQVQLGRVWGTSTTFDK